MDRYEAIEVLRKYNPKDAELREALETAVPELKESEYERIRREIIADIKEHHPNWMLYKDYTSWIKWLKSQVEPKTSEWSEDDNAKIEFLCNLIQRNISEGTYSFGDGAKNGFVSKQEAIKMLQSLKSRVQPHLKSEWSDEDEGIVSRIMTDLENCESEWGSNKEEEKDWLKSLKDRVQPHPAWKPTKQQMEAIKQAAEQNRASEMGNILDNLFVELSEQQ